jgi:hypothetical protein
MEWIMLTTILLQIVTQILSLAIEERREQQFVAMTPNNVIVGQQHFQNYHYSVKDHYNGEFKGMKLFVEKIPPLKFYGRSKLISSVNRSLT